MLRVWIQKRLSSKTRSGFVSAHMVRVAVLQGTANSGTYPEQTRFHTMRVGRTATAGGIFVLTSSHDGMGSRGLQLRCPSRRVCSSSYDRSDHSRSAATTVSPELANG